MKQFLTLIALSSLASVASFAAGQAEPASQTVLTVEVVNETPNGTAVEGDPVFVQIYDHGKVLSSLEGKVGADGKAVFENVPTGDMIRALARSKHNNMMFYGRAVALKPTDGGHVARIPVYDTSDDKTNLSITTHHLMITVAANKLMFKEYMQLVNSSNMAVTSAEDDEKSAVIEIKLPKGFKNLETLSYFEEQALVITDEGFYDTMAVPPGEYQVSFAYTLDITSSEMDIVKGITLPTAKLVVFAELGAAELHGLGEAKSHITSDDGAKIKYYTRDNLAAGNNIGFQITGFNVVADSGPRIWVILAVVFGVVLVLVALRMRPVKS